MINKEIIQGMYDSFASGDVAAVVAALSDNVISAHHNWHKTSLWVYEEVCRMLCKQARRARVDDARLH